MSRLVNDLLLLGQADSADAIERRPVLLMPIVERIIERAGLVSSGHTIESVHLDTIQVTGDIRRWPNIHDTFDITVSPA